MNAGHIVSLVSIGLDGRVITLEGLICSEQIMNQTVVKDGETERYRPKSRKNQEKQKKEDLQMSRMHPFLTVSTTLFLPPSSYLSPDTRFVPNKSSDMCVDRTASGRSEWDENRRIKW